MPATSRLIPLVVASALFMENMDSTVIATALPAIAARSRRPIPIVLKLAFTTYLLSLTVFIPISGWCADRFGARNVFRAAIVVFTLGSIACGFSDVAGGLVGGARAAGHGRRHDGAGRPPDPAALGAQEPKWSTPWPG